jgi:tetratricopeptide (TPR) repeat protein
MANAMGLSYANLGRDDEARAAYAEAVTVLEAVHGQDHLSLAVGLVNLGTSETRLGLTHEAITELTRAIRIREAKLGRDTVPVAEAKHLLADAMAAGGDHVGAQAQYKDAIATFDRAGKPKGAGYSHVGLGESLLAIGKSSEAIRDLERGLELGGDDDLATAELGDAHLALAKAVTASGGDPARAREFATMAIAEYDRVGASRARERAAATTLLAQLG